jgi:putative ABC transport system permease protein
MLKVTLRGLLSHKFRLVLTVVAVMVSVAFMCGTQILTATISTSFDKVFDDVYKNIDVVVRSSNEVDTGFGKLRSPISEAVIPDIAKVNGVEATEGQVQGQLTIIDKAGEPMGNAQSGPPTFGFNWLTQPALNGWHLNQGNPPTGPTEVVTTRSADKASFKLSEQVKLQINTGVKEFTLVSTGGFGTTENYAGSAAALFETKAAQELLTKPGYFNWINVAGQADISQEELRTRVAAVVPQDDQTITGTAFTAESQDVFRQFFNIIGTVLLVFGLVALFVGAFIIYNTFNIIVAQRTRELALLRAMGAKQGQVLGSVAAEAAIRQGALVLPRPGRGHRPGDRAHQGAQRRAAASTSRGSPTPRSRSSARSSSAHSSRSCRACSPPGERPGCRRSRPCATSPSTRPAGRGAG